MDCELGSPRARPNSQLAWVRVRTPYLRGYSSTPAPRDRPRQAGAVARTNWKRPRDCPRPPRFSADRRDTASGRHFSVFVQESNADSGVWIRSRAPEISARLRGATRDGECGFGHAADGPDLAGQDAAGCNDHRSQSRSGSCRNARRVCRRGFPRSRHRFDALLGCEKRVPHHDCQDRASEFSNFSCLPIFFPGDECS